MGRLYSTSEETRETAILVGVLLKGQHEWEIADSLDELEQLADTAGAEVLDSMLVKAPAPDAGTLIRRGKAEEIAVRVKELGARTVVFDEDLSPAQARNLEDMIGAKIIDRTQMILDIFAQHAFTREGALQIELAQLEYLLPRLRRMWTHLERQQGGIGMRGPGEKQLELDRRRIQNHISTLRRDLDQVRSRRAEQRRGRRRHGWALLTLVGYTNAGKSTLLNALTGSEVAAAAQLFATLDPTTRRLELPNNQMALLTDTVGFIRKLPHHLVESFKATLEEVNEADLLVHVVDLAHPRVEQQIEAVERVLQELGAGDKPRLSVLNKIDLAEASGRRRTIEKRVGPSVAVSARSGENLDELRHALADCLKQRSVTVKLRMPLSEGRLVSTLQQAGHILSRTYDEAGVLLEASVPQRLLGQLARYRVDGPGADGSGGDPSSAENTEFR